MPFATRTSKRADGLCSNTRCVESSSNLAIPRQNRIADSVLAPKADLQSNDLISLYTHELDSFKHGSDLGRNRERERERNRGEQR